MKEENFNKTESFKAGFDKINNRTDGEKEEDLRIRRTKRLLLDSLMQLLQEKSFEKIGVNDICERAMVHRATFYNHFDDKYDLFNFALSQLEEEMYLSTIESERYSSSNEMYISILKNVFDFIEKNKLKFKLIIDNNSSKLIFLISTTFQRSITYLIKQNELNQEFVVPLNIIIDFFMGGLTFLCLDWIKSDMYSKDEIIKFLEVFIQNEQFLKK